MTTESESGASHLPDFIGFPPPLLGPVPRRLPVIAAGIGWCVLEKPAGIHGSPDPWYPGENNIQTALRDQVAAGKPELAPLQFSGATVVHPVEPEVHGPLVVAGRRDNLSSLREECGSNLWRFHYLLGVEKSGEDAVREVDLPLSRHHDKPEVLVSHRTGKKALTRFLRIARGPARLDLWMASANYPRWHQVRVHAHEAGLRIAGENVYDDVAPLGRADQIGEWARRVTAPVHPFPLIILLEIRIESPLSPVRLRGSVPKGVGRWLKKGMGPEVPPPDFDPSILEAASR